MQKATANPNHKKAPADPPRPETKPHGTTTDQINEMESEGQGGGTADGGTPKQGATKDDSKARPVLVPNRTAR